MRKPTQGVGLVCLLVCAVAVRVLAGSPTTAAPDRILPPDQTLSEMRAYLHGHAPKFTLPEDASRWPSEAERLRQRVLDEVVLRGVPQAWTAAPLEVVWGETISADGYVIRKLRYQAVPGLWVGALLYEPTGLTEKVPAVLNPNGHVGKPGMTIEYKQARCINLAKRRMLALNLEWIGMGQLSGPGYGHNDPAYLDLCGRAGVSVFYLALRRGLDVLCSHKMADPRRVAVTGLSGGGWQTIVISALDERVTLAAPNAGYISLPSRIDHPGDIGDLEQNATDLVAVADYVHLTAMLAPRPALLIYNAKDECCFAADRARPAVYEPVLPLYKALGHSERFAFHVNFDPGTHNYLQDNRQAFYRFLNRHFLPESQWIDEDLPVDGDIRTSAQLAIAYPPDNANFHTLAAEAIKGLPRRKRPDGDAQAVEQWRRQTRQALAEIVRADPVLAGSFDVSEKQAAASFSTQTACIVGRLRLGPTWTLPVVQYAPVGAKPTTATLIVADAGWKQAESLAREFSARGDCVLLADLLFTGECVPGRQEDCWKYAQMIATVGRRPLGIQVSQLEALADWIGRLHPGARLRVVARGRVAGLAALVFAACRPDRIDCLELREMDSSLKQLLRKKVSYNQAPPLFCFGLLECVDVPQLVDLAHPTRIDLLEAK